MGRNENTTYDVIMLEGEGCLLAISNSRALAAVVAITERARVADYNIMTYISCWRARQQRAVDPLGQFKTAVPVPYPSL